MKLTRDNAPCGGDPRDWDSGGEWGRCDMLGTLTITALLPGYEVGRPVLNGVDLLGEDEVFVEFMACPKHVRSLRKWVRGKVLPGDQIDTWPTELILAEDAEIRARMAPAPVFRMVPENLAVA